MNCFLTIFALGVIGLVQSIPPDFDYDFSGFKQLTQLMPTTCNDIEGQIINKIGGIQKPSHVYDHITCAADETVGTRIKFTIHRDEDDDPTTGYDDRQRLEMFVPNHKTDLQATKGSTFIYAWWFNLSSKLIADTSYWHIFQIKPDGSNIDSNPMLTFTLKSNYGFHTEYFQDHHEGVQYDEILPIDEARGRWIQAFVKIHYDTTGSAEITLKNGGGTELYHNKLSGNFWWDGADYYKGKWGLYRHLSEKFNDSDFIYFQNVQIWSN